MAVILEIKSNAIKKKDLKKHFDGLTIPDNKVSSDIFQVLNIRRVD